MNHPTLMLTERELQICRQIVYNELRQHNRNPEHTMLTKQEHADLQMVWSKLNTLKYKFSKPHGNPTQQTSQP